MSRQSRCLCELYESLYNTNKDQIMFDCVKKRLQSLLESDAHYIDTQLDYLSRQMEGDLMSKQEIAIASKALAQFNTAIMVNRDLLVYRLKQM